MEEEKFEHQKKLKAKSEQKILRVLSESGHTFTELLNMTMLSKPVLTEHLKRLKAEGKVKKALDPETGKVLYQLTERALSSNEVKRDLFSILSTIIFNDIFEATRGKLTDEDFVQFFSKKIGALAIHVLLTGLEMSKDNPDEAGKWIEEVLGSLPQKYAWRRCLNRQIFRGSVYLKHPVELKEPVKPEFTVKEHETFVRLPEAFEPGITAKILHELPEMPKNRLCEIKTALLNFCPKEIETLDQLLMEMQVKHK